MEGHRHHVAVDALFDLRRDARVGAVLLSAGGRPLFCSRAYAVRSSSDAEMYALVAAMRFADTAGWENVVFRSDSQGTVVQVTDPMWSDRQRGPRGLRMEARSLLAAHPGWAVEWVKRGKNRVAHNLVARGPQLSAEALAA